MLLVPKPPLQTEPVPVFVPLLCSQGDLSSFLCAAHLGSDTGGVSSGCSNLGNPWSAQQSKPRVTEWGGENRGVLKMCN